MGQHLEVTTLKAKNLKLGFWKDKILKAAKIFNLGLWKAKILKCSKILNLGF